MVEGFRSSGSVIGEVTEMRFSLAVGGADVPGLICYPVGADSPLPLVLMQHPGMGSKDDYFVRDIAHQWAKRGWACAGLDAPLHGDRADHNPMTLFRDRDAYPRIRSQFAAEVHAALDAMAEAYPVDLSRLGFVGYSLGSMLGIPAVARDGRFKAAAFCLVGEGGLAGPAEGADADVPKLDHTAVLIVGKEQDELISRDATERLYEALPGKKAIRWLPGGHFEIGPDVVRAAEEWLVREL
jgi:dienelactone hydrolase